MAYQVISMFESNDGSKTANVLAEEGSPYRIDMGTAKFPSVTTTMYYTSLQQAEDAAENFVMSA